MYLHAGFLWITHTVLPVLAMGLTCWTCMRYFSSSLRRALSSCLLACKMASFCCKSATSPLTSSTTIADWKTIHSHNRNTHLPDNRVYTCIGLTHSGLRHWYIQGRGLRICLRLTSWGLFQLFPDLDERHEHIYMYMYMYQSVEQQSRLLHVHVVYVQTLVVGGDAPGDFLVALRPRRGIPDPVERREIFGLGMTT